MQASIREGRPTSTQRQSTTSTSPLLTRRRTLLSLHKSQNRSAEKEAHRNAEHASLENGKSFSVSHGANGIAPIRLNSKGTPLAKEEKNFFEERFQQDLSQVRIHNNEESYFQTKRFGAKAFTQGNDIYFSKNRYNPNSKAGKKLLAHELTHVMQQQKSGKQIIQMEPEDSIDEKSDQEAFEALNKSTQIYSKAFDPNASYIYKMTPEITIAGERTQRAFSVLSKHIHLSKDITETIMMQQTVREAEGIGEGFRQELLEALEHQKKSAEIRLEILNLKSAVFNDLGMFEDSIEDSKDLMGDIEEIAEDLEEAQKAYNSTILLGAKAVKFSTASIFLSTEESNKYALKLFAEQRQEQQIKINSLKLSLDNKTKKLEKLAERIILGKAIRKLGTKADKKLFDLDEVISDTEDFLIGVLEFIAVEVLTLGLAKAIRAVQAIAKLVSLSKTITSRLGRIKKLAGVIKNGKMAGYIRHMSARFKVKFSKLNNMKFGKLRPKAVDQLMKGARKKAKDMALKWKQARQQINNLMSKFKARFKEGFNFKNLFKSKKPKPSSKKPIDSPSKTPEVSPPQKTIKGKSKDGPDSKKKKGETKKQKKLSKRIALLSPEGNSGNYSSLVGGKQRYNKAFSLGKKRFQIESDHSPHMNLLKTLKKLRIKDEQKKTFSYAKVYTKATSQIAKFSYGQIKSRGICLNLLYPRHYEGRTWGKKSLPATNLALAPIVDLKNYFVKGISIPDSINGKRERIQYAREEARKKISKQMQIAVALDQAEVIKVAMKSKWLTHHNRRQRLHGPQKATILAKSPGILGLNKQQWPKVFQ